MQRAGEGGRGREMQQTSSVSCGDAAGWESTGRLTTNLLNRAGRGAPDHPRLSLSLSSTQGCVLEMRREGTKAATGKTGGVTGGEKITGLLENLAGPIRKSSRLSQRKKPNTNLRTEISRLKKQMKTNYFHPADN